MTAYIKRIAHYITLAIISAMAVLSVFGAFIGAEKTQKFFDTLPAAVYFGFMILLMTTAVAAFAKFRKPGVFLIHIGTVLILAGSVIASEKGQNICQKIFNYTKPTKTQMVIYQGTASNELKGLLGNKTWELPFEIRLKKFIVERYTKQSIEKLADGSGNYRVTYRQPVKDYISKVDVVKDGVVVKSADIEVNRPMHYGGFHFYQYGYDDKQQMYTVLRVVSDSGINTVYAGFAAIWIGIIWQCWGVKLRQK